MKTFFNSFFLILFYSAFNPVICQDIDMDGWTVQQGDCNDNNPRIYPGAPEVCGNTEDDNCNGKVDELEVKCILSIQTKLDNFGRGIINTDEILKDLSSNCSIENLIFSRKVFDCDDIPYRTVIATFIGMNNNTDTCHVQVKIIDEDKPNIECKNEFELELDKFGIAKITKTSDLLSSINDNCGIISSGILASKTQFDCNDIPSKDIIVSVSDKFKNQMNCTTKVKIIDRLGPSIKCKKRVDLVAEPKDKTFKLLNNTNLNYLESLTDICGIISNTSVSPQEVKLNNILPTKVELTVKATDINGNEGSCTTLVIIRKSPTDQKNDKDESANRGN